MKTVTYKPIKDINIIGNGLRFADIVMAADDMVINNGGWDLRQNGQGALSRWASTVKIKKLTVGGLNA